MSGQNWELQPVISREQALQLHRDVLGVPTRPIQIREDIFRLHSWQWIGTSLLSSTSPKI